MWGDIPARMGHNIHTSLLLLSISALNIKHINNFKHINTSYRHKHGEENAKSEKNNLPVDDKQR